jgi:hypothetical protein
MLSKLRGFRVLSGPMRATLLSLALLVAACGPKAGGPEVGSPAPQLRAWISAHKRNDPRAAYGLLSPERRKETSYADFERRWKESQQERDRQVAALEAGLRDQPSTGERATVKLVGDKSTTLVHEKGQWRMETPLFGSARASSPQEALRLFAEALEARSVEGVLRLLTSTRREGLSDVLDKFVAGVKTHSGGEIEITGDRAILKWNDGKNRWKITLRQENGEWRIDDVDMQ